MRNETELVLASGSPRRRELLGRLGIPFRVVVSDAEEIAGGELSAIEVAMRNARAKASAVLDTLSEDACVIGADTIVVLDGTIFGKPRDEEDARRMLHALSGRTHQVITGVCIARKDGTHAFAETTDVTFRDLSEDEVEAYVATGEPLDKAGSYGIQGLGGALVDHIDGDYDNVVGLPVEHLERALDLECGDKVDDGKHREQ